MRKKSHDRAPDKKGFSVALPKQLLAQIEEIAVEEHRSRNGQIEYFLDRAVKKWKANKLGDQTGSSPASDPVESLAPDPRDAGAASRGSSSPGGSKSEVA